jgi:hypothetical protein
MNSTNLKLPYRLSEKAFREYEDAIAQIVAAFPIAVKVEHRSKAPTTYSARLRDAIKSLDKYNWVTGKVNMLIFKSIRKGIVVRHTAKGVYAGSSEGMEFLDEIEGCSTSLANRPSTDLSLDPNEIAKDVVVPIEPFLLEDTDLHHIKATVFLASKGLLNRPIRISSIDDEQREYFEENFDVRLDKQPDGSYLLS